MAPLITSLLILIFTASASACSLHAAQKENANENEQLKEILIPQRTCTVMGGEINEELYVEKDGKRIYVCCAGCIEEVEENFNKHIGLLEELGQSVELIESKEDQ
ncbi:hypothetical protein QA601_02115 [Chitinispirillales bacterium ANBcel5]|uniref:hypothetical protein n=1 Tax=Cellulosispirillum alkaliphilum TaxID=3039283 RepID=UPI002A558E6D|nr:hypothetical protein [Chitinispirillales bacterium ANBcel5]